MTDRENDGSSDPIIDAMVMRIVESAHWRRRLLELERKVEEERAALGKEDAEEEAHEAANAGPASHPDPPETGALMAQAYDSGGGPISEELIRELEARARQMRAAHGPRTDEGDEEDLDPNATPPLADVVQLWRHRRKP